MIFVLKSKLKVVNSKQAAAVYRRKENWSS